MNVLMIQPGAQPRQAEIGEGFSAMQAAVGGPIQAIYPFPEPVALICHEEGKLLGLPLNRALRDKDGEIYDIIAGPFFLCGAPPDRDTFTSLTPEQMVHYKDRFCRIELYDTGRCDTRLTTTPYTAWYQAQQALPFH